MRSALNKNEVVRAIFLEAWLLRKVMGADIAKNDETVGAKVVKNPT